VGAARADWGAGVVAELGFTGWLGNALKDAIGTVNVLKDAFGALSLGGDAGVEVEAAVGLEAGGYFAA
jgi:hypothetical protein